MIQRVIANRIERDGDKTVPVEQISGNDRGLEVVGPYEVPCLTVEGHHTTVGGRREVDYACGQDM